MPEGLLPLLRWRRAGERRHLNGIPAIMFTPHWRTGTVPTDRKRQCLGAFSLSSAGGEGRGRGGILTASRPLCLHHTRALVTGTSRAPGSKVQQHHRAGIIQPDGSCDLIDLHDRNRALRIPFDQNQRLLSDSFTVVSGQSHPQYGPFVSEDCRDADEPDCR